MLDNAPVTLNRETLDVIDQYVLAYCEAWRRAVRDETDLPGPVLSLSTGGWKAGRRDIPPAKVQRLRPLLFQLPPIIHRKRVESLLGGIVSYAHLRNKDSEKKGPRVRIVSRSGVAYPTAYLLEWLEQEGYDVRIDL